MKNYKQILEAVHRGIKLALDDFDDNDDLIGQQAETIKDTHHTKEYLDDLELFKNNFIDLGLPSGTWWGKYNLGVNPDLLNTPENWFGDYYAWGELTPKKYYKLSNYKFNNLSKYDKKGKLNHLYLEDDVANLKLHFNNSDIICHIPTDELALELISYTNLHWIKNFNPLKNTHKSDDGGIQGLNGKLFTSKINGNKLFIPAGGGYYEPYPLSNYKSVNDLGIINIGVDGYIWLNNTYDMAPVYADTIHITKELNLRCIQTRFYGFNVRPIVNLSSNLFNI